MKKLALLSVLLLTLFSCAKDTKSTYTIEATLLDNTIDTFSVSRSYNKELRAQENTLVKSTYFTEEGVTLAHGLISTHPMASLYPDDLETINTELSAFIVETKGNINPLDERLVNNTIVFNRNLQVDKHKGQIKSFRVLSIESEEGTVIPEPIPQSKLMEFVNHPSVTAEELDAISYVRTDAANNIVNARPISNLENLDAISYVSTTAIDRMRTYAETWVNPDPIVVEDPVVTPSNNAPIITSLDVSLVTETSFKFTWLIDEGSKGQWRYGTSTGVYTTTGPLESRYLDMHRQTVSGLTEGTTYYYQIYTEDAEGNSAWSDEYTQTTRRVLDRTNWDIIYVDSEENHLDWALAAYMIDGDDVSIWCTEWRDSYEPLPPHEVQIDLGSHYVISELSLLPRPVGYTYGDIKDYEFYTSLDAITWTLTSSGTLTSTKDVKVITFTPTPTKYIKVVGLSSHSGPRMAIAELNLKGYEDTRTTYSTITPVQAAPNLIKVEKVGTAYHIYFEMPANSIIPTGGMDTYVNGVDQNEHLLISPRIIEGLDMSVENCFSLESRYDGSSVFPMSRTLCK